jgi:hypothetical protein
MTDFKWRHFAADIILHVMRRYCKYSIRYRALYQPALILTLRPHLVMAGLDPAIHAFRCAPRDGVRGEVRLINRQFGIYGA